MNRLTIAIPTFRRPQDLKRAVSGVLEQAGELVDGPRVEACEPEGDTAGAADADGGAGRGVYDVEVLVIDNDARGTGREAALTAAADAGVAVRSSVEGAEGPEAVGLRYVVEERPGVAAVRNRALDETGGRDLLVFIDDDEDPEPGWLAALVGLWASTGCQAVAGPVIPVYEVEPEAWVRQGEFFVRRTWPTGTVRPVAASNCLLLDLGFVRRAGLRFDEAFGATGGEDTLFTRRLSAAGGVIRWCDEARVRDHVPASRLTRPWILRRQRSHAATSVRVELALAGGGAQPVIRARAAAGGLVRIVVGGLRTAGGTLIGSPKHAAKGARLLARGRGILAASVGGGVHREYDH
ncbi:glycosyltransferase family 2 protein [Actinomyces sp. oral taxon 171]|uniref:glycosyltransferase family 2 protein n=1 Tax=Actinomyces sp. oral taxon 171 TaxID=706438 RepID=UPI0010FC143B|nr:glycosyltransferase [Actinomyces sp. oral taxon 171]QCT34028.1 glycosyltransferase [Actinomyces sp. oral taxon 171 str. F0337]